MGTKYTGRDIIAALKKADTWGTAVEAGANDGILVKSESFAEKREVHKQDSAGQQFIEHSDQGKKDVGGDFKMDALLDMIDLPLCLVMGAAGTPAVANTDQADIEAASQANPCQITWTGHGMTTGDTCFISGITQTDWTVLNGEQTITKVDDDKFTVAVDTSSIVAAYVPGTDDGIVIDADALVYSNSYTMANDIVGYFATLAFKKKSDVIVEYPSVKLNGFTLEGQMNQPLSLTFKGLADEEERSSSVNTTTTMGSVTYRNKEFRLLMDANSYFRVNDQSGDALDSDDNINPSGFSLTLERPMFADLVAGSANILEPAEDGFPNATLKLDFPRYDDTNDTFFDNLQADTEKKIELYFQGAVIDGSDYYSLKISCPKAKVNEAKSNISGAGRMPVSIVFDLYYETTAPSGMTGINEPFQIDVQNTLSTSPLA